MTPPSHPIVLGTAGHIDHGKTALVHALTGIQTDRLKEEQARGITIELGFAWLDLEGQRFGIVDVPGHERFVRTMVAGATGIDLVLLVVAADEGVMPQTREHLDICRLLGVPHGLVALTKADLVSPDWLELVREDVAAAVKGTFLRDAPMVPCSAHTGAGLDELRAALLQIAPRVAGRNPEGLLRLPIDRTFTMRGFGTVVTGTLTSGRLQEGDDVVALPGGATGKARGIQVHGTAVGAAVAGQRTAVNLSGVPRTAVNRGEVLTHPGALEPVSVLDAELQLLSVSRHGFRRRTRIICHAGTTQVPCTVILLEGDELPPGATGLAQLHLASPIVMLPDDRFILRGFTLQENYGTTVGGGRVVRVHSPRLRRPDPARAALLRQMAGADPVRRVELEVAAAGARGLRRVDLQRRLPFPPRAVAQSLDHLLAAGTLVSFGEAPGGAATQPGSPSASEAASVAYRPAVTDLQDRALAAVTRYHREQPQRPGLGREELRARLRGGTPPRLFSLALEELLSQGRLVVEHDLVRLPDHRGANLDRARRLLTSLYQERGLTPPRRAELADLVASSQDAGAPLSAAEQRDALDLLAREGVLVRAGPELYFHRDAIDDLRTRVRAFLQEHHEITAQQFKDLCGTTRKFAIPLAEHFDAEKLTIRVGEVRRLRARPTSA